jgi:hypothetical protein
MMSYNNNWVNGVRKTLSEAKKGSSEKAKSEAMLAGIRANLADARKKQEEAEEVANSSGGARRELHIDRAEHFRTHAENYQKHLETAEEHHRNGNYFDAQREGAYYASNTPHLRDVPYRSVYDHVEHNQEAMLNEDLLMLESDEKYRIICPNRSCGSVIAVPENDPKTGESTRGKLVRCRRCASNIRLPEKDKPDLGTPKQQVEEEMALNQDLLMLIDVLCEELGIDTEELLSKELSEATKMVSKKVEKVQKSKEKPQNANAEYKAWADKNPEESYDNPGLWYAAHNRKRLKLGLKKMPEPPSWKRER